MQRSGRSYPSLRSNHTPTFRTCLVWGQAGTRTWDVLAISRPSTANSTAHTVTHLQVTTSHYHRSIWNRRSHLPTMFRSHRDSFRDVLSLPQNPSMVNLYFPIRLRRVTRILVHPRTIEAIQPILALISNSRQNYLSNNGCDVQKYHRKTGVSYRHTSLKIPTLKTLNWTSYTNVRV